MTSIKIKVEDPALLTAAITRESAEDLELAIGDEVKAIIKSTEVMVAKQIYSIYFTFNFNFKKIRNL